MRPSQPARGPSTAATDPASHAGTDRRARAGAPGTRSERRTTSARVRVARAAVGIVAALAASPAQAQNAEAELLFREGDRLMAQGDLARACEAFEGSNRIEPRAGTLIRLGDCREKNNQLASAWSAYSDALARVKDPAKQQIAQAKVASLEPRLSYLTISVPDEARVAGLAITRNGRAVDAVLWNRGAPVDGGEYVVSGRAPGHEEWSTRVTVKPEGDKVSVEVPRFKELKALTSEGGAGGGAGLEIGAGPRDTRPRLTTRRKVAIGVAGGGVVVLVAAAIVGTQAQGLERQAQDLCADTICAEHARANQLLDDARGKARLANVGYGVAVAAGVGAGVLWFLGGGAARADGVAVAPAVGPGLAGAVVQGRF